MTTTELFYPEVRAVAGGYVFNQAVELEVYSDQESYFDWAKIRFTPEYKPNLTIGAREQGKIQMGYEGVLKDVLTGFVEKPYNSGGYLNEITIKDKMLLLEETDITNTFLQATPQEMISYGLARAGVTEYQLAPTIYPAKQRVPIYRKNVVALIEEIHAIWKIREKFFFSDDVFYWGVLPQQDEIYHFEYAVNIISLERPLRMWELTTVSMPFVKHSHKIQVTHPKVSGEFEVKKVVSTTQETGFIRTVIYF